mmetsp:Transcript_18341/g.42281  ORF Transcript_18341/g.42281 Transcript_18341/m.42281 type:complete len:381 (-) Transcript_18341:61-1203(-)
MLKRISDRHGRLWKPLLRTTNPSPPCALLVPSSASRRRFAASAASSGTDGARQRPRRRKQKYERFGEAKLAAGQVPTTTALESPFEYSGDSLEDYKTKTELSPWTPVPDSVARKIFDRAIPEDDECGDRSKEGEVHVELGSGDGRVNFHAIEYGVSESIGIEVDEAVVKLAEERLNRIHPRPDLRFVVSDLMDPDSVAWREHVPRATILTMYFAADGLEKIRPHLERALRGRTCKVFTCGYAMPGWDSQIVETVLDIPIHFYDWGKEGVNMMALQPSDSIADTLPPGAAKGAGVAPSDNMDQYMGRKNTKSTFVEDPLPGYHPDDLIDYGWMDDFGEKDVGKDAEGEGEDGKTEGREATREPPKTKKKQIDMLHNWKPPK